MLSRVLRTLSLTATLAVLPALALAAQEINFKVPFDFAVGNIELKAGEYRVLSSPGEHLVIFRGASQTAIVQTAAPLNGTSTVKAKLIFHRYGNAYFFSKVLLPWSGGGREMAPSKRERELARNGGAATVAEVLSIRASEGN